MVWPPKVPFLSGTNAQNWLVSFILGAGPGIYLAITGLGAGAGQSESARFSQIVNCLGNGIFGLGSLFAPLLLRYCSVRWFLVFGPTGYAAYILGLIYFQARNEILFPLILSVYFGLGSALTWVGTTYISIAYSTVKTKGHFVNNQWVGLALGATAGSAVALGGNFQKSKAAGVSYGVLAGWMAIHLGASIAAYLFVLPANRVKSHGQVIPAGRDIMGNATIGAIFREIFRTLSDPKLAVGVLAMFTSDFWLVFIGSWNSRNFSLRARSLNTFLYWIIQIPTAALLSYLLDRKGWSRRRRGLAGFTLLFVLVSASWFGFYLWQGLNPESADPANTAFTAIDWADGGRYVAGLAVYLVFGISYPTYHVVLVFYMSMLASEGDRKMAYYAGIFKALQGLGIAFAFGIGATTPNYMTEGIAFGGTAIFFLLPLGYGFWKYLSPEALKSEDDAVPVIALSPTQNGAKTDDTDAKTPEDF